MRSLEHMERIVRELGGTVDAFGMVNERTAALCLSMSYDNLQLLRRTKPKRCPPYKLVGGSARYSLLRLAEWLAADDRKLR